MSIKGWKTQRRYQKVWKNNQLQPRGVIIVRFNPDRKDSLIWWSACDEIDLFSKKKGFEIATKRRPMYHKLGTTVSQDIYNKIPLRLHETLSNLIADLNEYSERLKQDAMAHT